MPTRMTVDVILRHAVLLLLVTLDECDAQNSNYGTLIVKSPFLPDESISSDKRTPVYRPSGTNVTLECSRADRLIFLYRDEANEGNEISTNQQPMYTIYEVSFPLSNNRVYGCAKTTIGSLLSITLIVLAPPVLYNTTVEYKTGFGKISLECSAYGNPDPSVSIAYRDKIISPSSSAKAEKISVSGRVIDGIRNVVEVDINSLDDYTNSYACLVNNSQGNLTRMITIQPLALPTVEEIETVPSPVLIGSNFSLTCSATGNPLPTIVWIKPNASSNTTVKGTLSSHQSYVTSVLVIRSAQYENSGKYECIAMTGPVYEDHASRVVTVADTPSYPADISVTNVTSVSAVVIFKLQFDERFPILTSTIQLTLANASQSRQIMTNGTFAILKELDPYNAYYVEVLSTNALGDGEYSPRQLFWTDTAIPDGIPSTVMVSDINSTAVLVQWKDISKSKWNSPSRGYVIQYGSKSHEVQKDETQATMNISFAVISGLDEYMSYNFSVAAYNSKGKGGFSHSVSIRTKEDKPSAPPNNVAVVDRQSKSAVVFYDLPDEKDINGILLGFKVIAKNNRFIVFNTTVSNRTFNSDGVYTNVTGLRPYTLYTVQVVAFTEPGTGPWSQPVTFRTDEEKAGPPTKLQAKRVYSIAVCLQWLPPDSPANITRYLITYFGDNKNSSKFVETSRNNTVQGAVIHGLTANTIYTFVVYAVNSEGIGQASLNVSVASLSGSMPPSPPQNVIVTALTSSSLHVQWNPPSQSNGALQFYKVYYKPSLSNDDFSISKNIPIEENSFDITGLLPYTTYDIYVTVIKDAKTNPENQLSQTVQGRTHTAPPIVPEVPVSANNNGQFTAPPISNSNGPVSFIYIIVYHGPLDVCSPSNTDIPKSIGAYSDSSNWYVAAKYTYQEYESNIAGKSFVIGDGQTTAVNGEEYTNVEVTPGYRYSIYILITSAGDSEDYGVSTAPIQYAVALSTPSDSDSVDVIIAAVVPTVILLFVNVLLVIKLTRRTHKLDDSVSTSNPAKMETTYLHDSSAYGLTGSIHYCHQCMAAVVQSAKLNEEAYEEIPSSTTQNDNEPTHSSVMN